MRKRQPTFTKTAGAEPGVFVASLPHLVDSWLLAGDINQHSERTLESRRERMKNVLWFLQQREMEFCGLQELRQLFHYMNHGHKEPGGRWGNLRLTKAAVSSGTVKTYHSTLRAFFSFLVREGEIDASPMDRILPPIDRCDQVEPFTQEQFRSLLAAAKKSRGNPRRDEAILLLLYDTGIRASELCGLVCRDVDLHGGQVTIRYGKGGKSRKVPIAPDTKRALYMYLNERGLDESDSPVFLSERGKVAGDGLTRNGLLQLIRRIGRAAKVSDRRCSPHTFRHSFAVEYLRGGGNVFALKLLLGHESLTMVNRYVALAQADLVVQHRQFSPVARLRGRRS